MDVLGVFNLIALAGLVVIAWLLRHWLVEQVKGSVRGEFDQKLETLKGQIQSRQSELEALRSVALSSMLASQTATSARRVKAVDGVWAAVCEWWTLNATVAQVSAVNLEEDSKRIADDPELQTFFAQSNAAVPPNISALGLSADPARPYISQNTWALYEAYKSIFAISIFYVTSFRNGIDPRPFIRLGSAHELIKAMLPEKADVVTRQGTNA